MLQPNRRDFFATVAMASTGVAVQSVGGTEPESDGGVPMLHATDLFRPHDDPDDHWDLACVYALARQGRIDLRGVLIDYPQPGRDNAPDIQAVAQMNYVTGQAVPVMVGASRTWNSTDARRLDTAADVRGIRAFLELLRQSDRPVVINILGSCRDVAIAGRLEPELFAAKCRAVYLNAGSGTPDASSSERLEWNVNLDPASYAAIFRLPCPVYWMPCFETVPDQGRSFEAARYGTFYRFRQADVLPHLPDRIQNFFASMYRAGPHVRRASGASDHGGLWLQALLGPVDFNTIQQQANQYRNMWCTAGFLHACGLTVTRTGHIVDRRAASDPVFCFEPVRVECSESGVTRWKAAVDAPPRYLFEVRHIEDYPSAMTAALRTLISALAE